MSAAERAQRIGEIVHELAKARQELARSETHTKGLANTLRKVAKRLEVHANGSPEPPFSKRSQALGGLQPTS